MNATRGVRMAHVVVMPSDNAVYEEVDLSQVRRIDNVAKRRRGPMKNDLAIATPENVKRWKED